MPYLMFSLKRVGKNLQNLRSAGRLLELISGDRGVESGGQVTLLPA